jgi:hypothetical protein
MDESVDMLDVEPGPQHSASQRKHPSQYIYEPLVGANTIRVLRLHTTKERIECSLQQISISDGGYQALSYVWGDPEKHFSAVVLDKDGHELGHITLTKNLHSALFDLREAKDVKTKVFWIDQICIDQEGEEKNHQVAMMGKIYLHAARVITYLGPTIAKKEEEDCGIWLLEQLNQHFFDNYDMIYQAGSLWDAYQVKARFPVQDLPPLVLHKSPLPPQKYIRQGWRWVLQVAYGEWTQRMWMVQEQLLNKANVMLHGSSLLSWDAVANIVILSALELISRHRVDHFLQQQLPYLREHLHEIESSVFGLWQQRKRQEKTGDPAFTSRLMSNIAGLFPGRKRQKITEIPAFSLPLIMNMAYYEGLQCWDARDRIFALLSISKDAVQLGIVPNYSVSACHAFFDASIRILRAETNLAWLTPASRWADSNLLDKVHSENLDPTLLLELPSWALRPPPRRLPQSIAFRICTPHPQTSLLGRTPRLQNNNSVLVLKGRALDSISMSCSVHFFKESTRFEAVDTAWIDNISQQLICFFEVFQHVGITAQNAASLCRAMIALPKWPPSAQIGLSVDQKAAFQFWSYCRYNVQIIKNHNARRGLDMGPFLQQCDGLIQELAAELRGKIETGSARRGDPLGTGQTIAFKEFQALVVFHGRSLCVTEAGRFCNAMNQPKKGDVIAAFQGAERLFLLRSVGDKYRMVGEAYVDGLMKGEAYERLDPDEVDYEIELI